GLVAGAIAFGIAEKRHSATLAAALAAGQARLAESYCDRGLALCRQGDGGQGLLWLARGLETAPDGADELRHFLRASLAAWRCQGSPLGCVRPQDGVVTAAAFSPDGTVCATGGRDGALRLWDPATGRPLGEPGLHAGPVWAVAFSPDGKAILTGSGNAKGGEARLWDAATGQPLGEPLAHPAAVRSVAFGPGGQTLVTVCDAKAARF